MNINILMKVGKAGVFVASAVLPFAQKYFENKALDKKVADAVAKALKNTMGGS